MKLDRFVSTQWLSKLSLIMVSSLLSTCSLSGNCKPASQSTKGSSVHVAATDAEKAPIRIGLLASMTGMASDDCKQMLDGFSLYLNKINNQINGHKVELITEDDQSRAPIAALKVKKLVEHDKVDVITGVFFSPIAIEVGKLADQYRIPFVDAIAGSDDLTQRRHPKWLMRTSWTGSQAGLPFGEYAFKTLGYKKVATVAMDYQFGWQAVGGFQQSFEDAGGQIVQKTWLPLDSKDFAPLIRDINKNADAIFVLSVGQGANVLLRQLRERTKVPIIGYGNATDEVSLPVLKDDAVNVVTVMPYSAALDTPANKKFVQAYRAKFSVEPGWYSACGYTAAMAIVKAAESLNGDVSDKSKMLAALKKIEISDDPRGALKFDELGGVTENMYLRKVEKVNGKYQNTVKHTFPMVSQFGKYSQKEFLEHPMYSKDYPACTHCTQ
jgi:branched-chain amino acid transport system substrate-binding protein